MGTRAEPVHLGIIYPKSDEPAYQKIFDEVVNAAEHSLGGIPNERLRLENPTGSTVKRWLTEKSPTRVITLGRLGFIEFQATGSSVPAVSGLLDLSPAVNPQATGISLSVDPKLNFELLKRLLPNTRKVYIIFDPAKDAWLIELGRQAAQGLGLELVGYPEATTTLTTRHYLELITQLKPHEDALWLPMDPRVFGDDSLLYEIIDASWDRHFAVFSQSLTHARAGALFALYPNTEALGRHLAEWALRLPKKSPPIIEPLRDVHRAVNRRFAEHLGVEIRGETAALFETIFGRAEE